MSTAECVPNHHVHYGSFSGPTGLLAALTMVPGREEDARLATRLCGLAAGDRAVDIGCGPGVAARYAAELGATVVAVDPAPVMLRVARTLTRGKKVDYRQGTAEQLPVDDASANCAWSIACVHHWQDVDAGLQEARRVLTSSGSFVAIERQREPGARGHASHGWTVEQADAFADRCRALGFGDVRVERATVRRGKLLAVVAATP